MNPLVKQITNFENLILLLRCKKNTSSNNLRTEIIKIQNTINFYNFFDKNILYNSVVEGLINSNVSGQFFVLLKIFFTENNKHNPYNSNADIVYRFTPFVIQKKINFSNPNLIRYYYSKKDKNINPNDYIIKYKDNIFDINNEKIINLFEPILKEANIHFLTNV